MTWEIFLGISALVAFGVAVVTPIIKLNSSITKLNCAIDMLNASMAKSDKRLDAHSVQLDNHEKRITILECKGDKHEN